MTGGIVIGLAALIGVALYFNAAHKSVSDASIKEKREPIRSTEAEAVVLQNSAGLDKSTSEREVKEFDDTPLFEVLAAFNSRNELQIELVDEELASLNVSGMLDTGNPDALLHLLELIFEIEVERLGENHVALKSSSKAL